MCTWYTQIGNKFWQVICTTPLPHILLFHDIIHCKCGHCYDKYGMCKVIRNMCSNYNKTTLFWIIRLGLWLRLILLIIGSRTYFSSKGTTFCPSNFAWNLFNAHWACSQYWEIFAGKLKLAHFPQARILWHQKNQQHRQENVQRKHVALFIHTLGSKYRAVHMYTQNRNWM